MNTLSQERITPTQKDIHELSDSDLLSVVSDFQLLESESKVKSETLGVRDYLRQLIQDKYWGVFFSFIKEHPLHSEEIHFLQSFLDHSGEPRDFYYFANELKAQGVDVNNIFSQARQAHERLTLLERHHRYHRLSGFSSTTYKKSDSDETVHLDFQNEINKLCDAAPLATELNNFSVSHPDDDRYAPNYRHGLAHRIMPALELYANFKPDHSHVYADSVLNQVLYQSLPPDERANFDAEASTTYLKSDASISFTSPWMISASERYDLPVLREILTEEIFARLAHSPDARQYLDALAVINPGAIYTYIADRAASNHPDESQLVLEVLVLNQPAEISVALEKGVISLSDLKDNLTLLADLHPQETLSVIGNLPALLNHSDETINQCLSNLDLPALKIALETNLYLSQYLIGHPEKNRQIVAAIISQVQAAENIDERLRLINEYSHFTYPWVADLEVFRHEVINDFPGLDQKILTALSKTAADLPEFDRPAQGELSGKYLEDIIHSIKFNLNAFNDLFPDGFRENDRYYVVLRTLLSNSENESIESLIHDFLEEWFPNTLSSIQKEHLSEIIIEKKPDSFVAIDTISQLYVRELSLPESLSDLLAPVIEKSLSAVEAEMPPELNPRQAQEITEKLFWLEALLPKINRPDLIDRYLRVICRSERLITELVPANLKYSDESVALLKTLTVKQQEMLVNSCSGSTLYAVLKNCRFGDQQHRREIFYQARDRDELLQYFSNFGEFVFHSQLIGDAYSQDEVKKVINLRRHFGEANVAAVFKAFNLNRFQIPDISHFVVFNQALVTQDRDVISYLSQFRALIIGGDFGVHDLADLQQDLRDIRQSPARAIAKAKRLGIDIKKKTDEINDQISPYQKNYLLEQYQLRKGNLTQNQIETVIQKLNLVVNHCQLTDLAQLGLLGKNLETIYRHLDPLINAISDNVAMNHVKLDRVLDIDNLDASIALLVNNASQLGTTRPEWDRLTALAMSIISSPQYQQLDIISYHGEELEPSPDIVDKLSVEIASALKNVYVVESVSRQTTSRENREWAESYVSNGNVFQIPEGSLSHATRPDFLSAIIRLGNLSGECLGHIEKKADSFPGYVDLQEITSRWGHLTPTTLLNHPHLFGDDATIIYLPGRVQVDRYPVTSGHVDHCLVTAGIGPDQPSFILLNPKSMEFRKKDDYTELLANLKSACVEAEVYIPIISSSTGELLFLPDEFDQLSAEMKIYPDLSALISSKTVYPESLWETSNPNGVYHIAEHMELAVTNLDQILPDYQISAETAVLVKAAAKLHDVGKTSSELQEISNVKAASEILNQVTGLSFEQRRRILILIRNDELLGEILKKTYLQPNGAVDISGAAEKIKQFKRIFSDPEMRDAMIALYRADVISLGDHEYEDWQVDAKLAGLKGKL